MDIGHYEPFLKPSLSEARILKPPRGYPKLALCSPLWGLENPLTLQESLALEKLHSLVVISDNCKKWTIWLIIHNQLIWFLQNRKINGARVPFPRDLEYG